MPVLGVHIAANVGIKSRHDSEQLMSNPLVKPPAHGTSNIRRDTVGHRGTGETNLALLVVGSPEAPQRHCVFKEESGGSPT